MAVTPPRPIRVDDDLWKRFGHATTLAGADRSATIRDFMAWYARDPGAKMPRRPDQTPATAERTPVCDVERGEHYACLHHRA